MYRCLLAEGLKVFEQGKVYSNVSQIWVLFEGMLLCHWTINKGVLEWRSRKQPVLKMLQYDHMIALVQEQNGF